MGEQEADRTRVRRMPERAMTDRADLDAVLDAGRVVEQGPHHELVAAGGRYAGLWMAWSGARGGTEPDTSETGPARAGTQT